MQVGGYAPYSTAEYDAYMGSESADPDTIVRIRVKIDDRKFLATFTVDTEGKVFGVGMSPL